MFKKVHCLTRPTQAHQDAPFHGQGRSHFDERSVLIVRERERREERQVCEPEGSAKGPERRWRLFSTFPLSFQLHGHRSYARLIESMDDGGPRRGSRHQLNNLQTPPSLFFYFFPTTWLLFTKGLGFSTYFCPPAFDPPRP